MGSKYTKRYTEEFKRDAIALVDSSGKTVTAVARELGISSESLRGWYRKAKAEQGEGTPGELSSAEREELREPVRLPRDNAPRSDGFGSRCPIARLGLGFMGGLQEHALTGARLMGALAS